MNKRSIPRIFAGGLLAALLLLTAGFSFAVAAQGWPTLTVMASGGTARCAQISQDRPAVVRGEKFALSVHGLMADEPVAISLTFPDGRVYSPAVTQPGGPNELDGVAEAIVDPGFFGQTNPGGDYDVFFTTTNAWPRGCYRVTAQGISSQIQAANYVVLEDGALPQNEAGPLVLEVRSRTSQQDSGAQGVMVDLFGRKFMSGEVVQLRMVQPDGTIIDLPPPSVSLVGSFQASVSLGANRQTGAYTFVATSGNGHSKHATFTLTPEALTPRGVALLNISSPSPAVTVQGGAVQLQGRLFEPGEAVSIRLLQPNGVIRNLAQVQTNELGEFTVDLPFNQQFPVGLQTLVASSASALVTIDFQLNLGPNLVPPVTLVEPILAAPPGDGSGGGSDGGSTAAPASPTAGAAATISPTVTVAAPATATAAAPTGFTATTTVTPDKAMSGMLPPVTATPQSLIPGVDVAELIPIEELPASPLIPIVPAAPTPVF